MPARRRRRPCCAPPSARTRSKSASFWRRAEIMPLRRTYRALRHQVGYRGTVLLAFGFLDLGYGYGLLYPDRATSRGPSFAYYDSVLSSNIWGLLWLIAGVVLI